MKFGTNVLDVRMPTAAERADFAQKKLELARQELVKHPRQFIWQLYVTSVECLNGHVQDEVLALMWHGPADTIPLKVSHMLDYILVRKDGDWMVYKNRYGEIDVRVVD